MGVPNNPDKVHERNIVLSNIWSGGSHTSRDKLVQCSDLGFNLTKNSKLMLKQLNLLKERQELATIRLAKYQQKLAQRYNRDVRKREFVVGDLVLQKVVGNTRDVNAGKLAPTWEGPYRVTAIAGARTYYLENLDKRPLPRPWNAHNLKKLYN